jgi:serine/threonine protein kinase
MSVSAPMKQDTALGKALVEQGFCTRQEIEDCLNMRAEAAEASDGSDANQRSLADVLIENGYATRSQIDRVKSTVDESSTVQQIPGYQIISKLGAGAMATVYKARQLSLDRMVAIKVLPAQWSNNPEYIQRFFKEGKAAARLNHANIVGAVDVGEANGKYFFVMEFVEGKTVHDKLENHERYTEKEALDIIIQVCKALVHAHAAGFIHRDVKPKNIMITPSGIAKLADMGLARDVSDKEAAELEAGKAYGTPYYIAPEQIKGELAIDARADLYSLGATLYHMVTGRVPFDGPTPSAVMHKHLKEELIAADHINPNLSNGIAEVIEKSMAKRARDRYQNAAEMLADLERVARGEAPSARTGYDLNALANLESSGTTTGKKVITVDPDTGQQTISTKPVSDQNTIDVGPKNISPLLLASGALNLVLLIVLFLVIIFKH